jgi:hypothetical protein
MGYVNVAKAQELAKFIRYDVNRSTAGAIVDDPRPGHSDQYVAEPEIDENGFPIYTAPVAMVKDMISRMPTKFRLVEQRAPLVCRVEDANMGVKWVKFFPWSYKRETVQDKETGGHYWRYSWKEEVIEDLTNLPMVTEGQPEPAAAPSAPVARPAPSMRQSLDALKAAASAVVGQDAVRGLEADFREQIKKPKGLYNREEYQTFTLRLRALINAPKEPVAPAVAVADAGLPPEALDEEPTDIPAE